MREINLLPTELAPNRAVLVIANRLKKISIIGFIILLVISIASLGVFIVLSRQLNDLSSQKNSLQSELKNLSKTETTIVFIKDRVNKAKGIVDENFTVDSLQTFNKVSSEFPAGIKVTKATFVDKNISIDVTALDSLSLGQFIDLLLSSNLYTNITLKGINFNPSSGYSTIFVMDI